MSPFEIGPGTQVLDWDGNLYLVVESRVKNPGFSTHSQRSKREHYCMRVNHVPNRNGAMWVSQETIAEFLFW